MRRTLVYLKHHTHHMTNLSANLIQSKFPSLATFLKTLAESISASVSSSNSTLSMFIGKESLLDFLKRRKERKVKEKKGKKSWRPYAKPERKVAGAASWQSVSQSCIVVVVVFGESFCKIYSECCAADVTRQRSLPQKTLTPAPLPVPCEGSRDGACLSAHNGYLRCHIKVPYGP